MTKEILEFEEYYSSFDKYYKKGGTYEMPSEIFSNLIVENQRLKQALDEIKNYINTTDTFVINNIVHKLKDEHSGKDILQIIAEACK